MTLAGKADRDSFAALEHAKARDGVILVQLTVTQGNDSAQALYERCGFVRRGPFGDYQADPLSVFMEKRL